MCFDKIYHSAKFKAQPTLCCWKISTRLFVDLSCATVPSFGCHKTVMFYGVVLSRQTCPGSHRRSSLINSEIGMRLPHIVCLSTLHFHYRFFYFSQYLRTCAMQSFLCNVSVTYCWAFLSKYYPNFRSVQEKTEQELSSTSLVVWGLWAVEKS